MTDKYEVGVKLRFVGDGGKFFTEDKTYEINEVLMEIMYVKDDYGSEHGLTFSFADDNFEVYTPSVTDILANLALRVSELERHNREQAYEINELYKEVSR